LLESLSKILSVQLYAIGDDDFNLLVENADWYFFYDILFLTFFLLLIKYRTKKYKVFKVRDYLFFIPYIVFVVVKFLESTVGLNKILVAIGGLGMVLASFAYIVYIFKMILESKEKWITYFMIPYAIIFLADRLGHLWIGSPNGMPFLESYGIIGLTAILLYGILYKFIQAPSTILPEIEMKKYKKSNLDPKKIDSYKKQLEHFFIIDRVFENNKLSVLDVAKMMGIPRQHLSELFSVHLETNFQDYLNSYRVEAFIAYLKDESYKNYTLLGIAKEVGFNSKTSFYTTFKKLKGMTPLEYKKKMIENSLR